jgi:16S rRNA (guanine527-N7)-methyltransferase
MNTAANDPDRALEDFVRRVEESPHNLVSQRARHELRSRHVPECRAFAQMLPAGPAHVLDVGSGGGFPGLVVALVRPDLQVVLLDATKKKVDFLRQTATDLGLAVEVVHGRAEELQRGHLAGTFDIVTARAVAPLARLIGWTVPFLRPGGLLYAIKGERWEEEVDGSVGALQGARAELVATPDDLRDPDNPHAPHVVIIRRTPSDGAVPSEDSP